MALLTGDFAGQAPLILTVPGLNGSDAAHWQTLWERTRDDCTRADLGMWDAPRRNAWVTKLDQAIRNAPTPVILVAHGLGCLTVAWWAALSGQPYGWPVAGALLVAPPDARRSVSPAFSDFLPLPNVILPFPAILAASEDDPHGSIQSAFDMARSWGCHFESVGACGHVNGASGLGLWEEGRHLLDRVIRAASAGAGGQPASRIHALLGEEDREGAAKTPFARLAEDAARGRPRTGPQLP